MQPAPTSATHPNVLIIAVDTLRADKLGCYGSTLGASPNIDALAKESVRFAQAYSHAPWTVPSFASLYTGQTPAQHGAGGQLGHFKALPDSARTVAECFHHAGYATAAIVNVEFLTRSVGLHQGFAHFDDRATGSNANERNATETTDAALTWLSQHGRRSFLLLVHYFDPHLVYDPPAEFRRKFADPRDRNSHGWLFGSVEDVLAVRDGKVPLDPALVRRMEKLHDGEVAYTDQQIGRLLAGLAAQGHAESTIVVFVADHGEEFLDHGGFEHGHTLYNELLQVPLLIRYPRQLRPAEVTVDVGLIDVAPTLCALARIPPDPAFAGQSLFPASGTLAARAILMEGNFWGPAHRRWLEDGYKLTVHPEGSMRLCNLRADPHEQFDLSTTRPDLARRLETDLEAARAVAVARSSGTATSAPISPENLQRLRSLGYVR